MLSIVEFSPTHGRVGESVKIFGTEFSGVANAIRVTFCRGTSRVGASALVLSSTPPVLVARVPSGATSGPITVSTPAGSAKSNEPFIIVEPLYQTPTGPPRVLVVEPALAAVDDLVTVGGINFSSIPSENAVLFNGVPGAVLSATATELAARVPPGAGSGRITVTAPGGTGSSSRDVFVVPPPYTVADVAGTARVALGGPPKIIVLSRPPTLALDLVALVVFDGNLGQQVRLVASDSTFHGLDLAVLDPVSALLLAPRRVGTDGGSVIDLPALPLRGTYTMLLSPRGAQLGTITLGLTAVNR